MTYAFTPQSLSLAGHNYPPNRCFCRGLRILYTVHSGGTNVYHQQWYWKVSLSSMSSPAFVLLRASYSHWGVEEEVKIKSQCSFDFHFLVDWGSKFVLHHTYRPFASLNKKFSSLPIHLPAHWLDGLCHYICITVFESFTYLKFGSHFRCIASKDFLPLCRLFSILLFHSQFKNFIILCNPSIFQFLILVPELCESV